MPCSTCCFASLTPLEQKTTWIPSHVSRLPEWYFQWWWPLLDLQSHAANGDSASAAEDVLCRHHWEHSDQLQVWCRNRTTADHKLPQRMVGRPKDTICRTYTPAESTGESPGSPGTPPNTNPPLSPLHSRLKVSLYIHTSDLLQLHFIGHLSLSLDMSQINRLKKCAVKLMLRPFFRVLPLDLLTFYLTDGNPHFKLATHSLSGSSSSILGPFLTVAPSTFLRFSSSSDALEH